MHCCFPAVQWRLGNKTGNAVLTGEVGREIPKIYLVSEAGPIFADYSVWLRSSPELLSWSTMEIWFGLPSLPWDIFLALSRLLFICLEYRLYCMCCVCWCFPGEKGNISRAWFQSGREELPSCFSVILVATTAPPWSYRLSSRTTCKSKWWCTGVSVPCLFVF